jgi:hypothetical protein
MLQHGACHECAHGLLCMGNGMLCSWPAVHGAWHAVHMACQVIRGSVVPTPGLLCTDESLLSGHEASQEPSAVLQAERDPEPKLLNAFSSATHVSSLLTAHNRPPDRQPHHCGSGGASNDVRTTECGKSDLARQHRASARQLDVSMAGIAMSVLSWALVRL